MKKIVFLMFACFLVVFAVGESTGSMISLEELNTYEANSGEKAETPFFDEGDGLIVMNSDKGKAIVIPFEEYNASEQEQNFVWKDVIGLGDVNIAESTSNQNGSVTIDKFFGISFHDMMFTFIPMTLELFGQHGTMTIDGYNSIFQFDSYGSPFGTSVLTNFVAQPVPEPSSIILTFIGLIMLAFFSRGKISYPRKMTT